MEYEAEADDVVGHFEKEKCYINDHRVVGMQRVKIDATSVGFKDGIGEQMVEIYEHRGE